MHPSPPPNGFSGGRQHAEKPHGGSNASGSAQVPPDAARFRIAYATFFGGPEGAPTYEEAREVIPDADGSILFGAMVKSKDLPVSKGAFQRQYAGDEAGSNKSSSRGRVTQRWLVRASLRSAG